MGLAIRCYAQFGAAGRLLCPHRGLVADAGLLRRRRQADATPQRTKPAIFPPAPGNSSHPQGSHPAAAPAAPGGAPADDASMARRSKTSARRGKTAHGTGTYNGPDCYRRTGEYIRINRRINRRQRVGAQGVHACMTPLRLLQCPLYPAHRRRSGASVPRAATGTNSATASSTAAGRRGRTRCAAICWRRCGNFDIILGPYHLTRGYQPATTPLAPCAVFYLVPGGGWYLECDGVAKLGLQVPKLVVPAAFDVKWSVVWARTESSVSGNLSS